MPGPDRKRRLIAFVVTLALLVATPLTVVASDVFTDVPSTNVFHDDITWLANAGVTKGCNPPANTQFCPSNNVTREQMAAFMHRLAVNKVVDAGSLNGEDPASYETEIIGSSRNTEDGTTNTIALAGDEEAALNTVATNNAHGQYALVTYGFVAADTAPAAGEDRRPGFNLDSSDCTLPPSPPYDQILDGSLVIEDYANTATAHVSGSMVVAISGGPEITLAGVPWLTTSASPTRTSML